MKDLTKFYSALVFSLLLHSHAYAQPSNLANVTLGFGSGYSYVFADADEYSLTTDTMRALKVSKAPKGGFVISSIITVRLGKVATAPHSNKLLSQSKIAAHGAAAANNGADFKDRITLNLAINLADVNSDGLSFNKPVDGGLGLGYSFSDNVQVALFLDVIRVRQLRPYVVENYKDKPIPNGTDNYTALDPNDNELFTTKNLFGVSLKVIYTLANHD